MASHADAHHTLPSVIASIEEESGKQDLFITIAFHPDTTRIGSHTNLGSMRGEKSRIVGRQTPYFGLGESTELPLDDLYISREALRLCQANGAVTLKRCADSSRVSVDGHEMVCECLLEDAQLERGVCIVLGGRIVLLLHRIIHAVVAQPNHDSERSLLGSSAYMANLREQISKLAVADVDVLIRGETGTGKELVAEALHATSGRASGDLVAVNMAAIPASLAPSILFGSARGAYSGADKTSRGYFEQAEGGTLFLDEVGDTPEEIQPQLLRALQQREIQVVGGSIRKVNVRVISATDASLDNQSCNFKAALRHRLSQSEISLLPLREHAEDVGTLLWAFIKIYFDAFGRNELLPTEQSNAYSIARWADLFSRFLMYAWPGNIRELRNFSQQIAVTSGATLSIPSAIIQRVSGRENTAVHEQTRPFQVRVAAPKKYSEEAFIEGYEKARFEVSPAARQLGLSRQAIYRRIADIPGLCLADELPRCQVQEALDRFEGDVEEAAMSLRVSFSALQARLRNEKKTKVG
jgi:DNA-binding NtrC family response regulator